jgi:hypothetical protein
LVLNVTQRNVILGQAKAINPTSRFFISSITMHSYKQTSPRGGIGAPSVTLAAVGATADAERRLDDVNMLVASSLRYSAEQRKQIAQLIKDQQPTVTIPVLCYQGSGSA